jgi:hypothetical protein
MRRTRIDTLRSYYSTLAIDSYEMAKMEALPKRHLQCQEI